MVTWAERQSETTLCFRNREDWRPTLKNALRLLVEEVAAWRPDSQMSKGHGVLVQSDLSLKKAQEPAFPRVLREVRVSTFRWRCGRLRSSMK